MYRFHGLLAVPAFGEDGDPRMDTQGGDQRLSGMFLVIHDNS